MLISYFDSSLLLSILLNETRSEEALTIWQNNRIRVSSVLLKFEMNISLRRRIKHKKSIFSDEQVKARLQNLDKFLSDIFYKDITEDFEISASRNYDILSKCKTLDAIHLATAIDISQKYGKNEICICSFDNNMLSVAKELGFGINGV